MKNWIDLRSDTVTQPTPEMRKVMAEAPVGDDVFGDDPTVNKLEDMVAQIFGKEAGLYCASGTMANQIAINVHTQPGDELICHEEAHIYRYEGGGIARNSGVSVRFIRGNQGRLDPLKIEENINPADDPHYPITRLVCAEDTANRGGGVVNDFSDIQKASKICKKNGLIYHLDGARVFNALAVNQVDPVTYGNCFDTISICLSKGLGAPVGSVLVGSKKFIKEARRVRKVLGGGMRQAGIIAAGGIFALQNHVERLKDDHENAKRIEKILRDKKWVESVVPTETNIVVAHLAAGLDEKKVVENLKQRGILAVAFGKGRVRFTTHLHITDKELNHFESVLPNEL